MLPLLVIAAAFVLLCVVFVGLTHTVARRLQPEARRARAVYAVSLLALFLTAWAALGLWLRPGYVRAPTWVPLDYMYLAFAILPATWIYCRVYADAGRRKWKFLGLQLIQAALLAGVVFALQSFVAQAHSIQTTAMAPTLACSRIEGPCKHCNSIALEIVLWNPDFAVRPRCINCRQSALRDDCKLYGDDWVFVDKLRSLNRWDMVLIPHPDLTVTDSYTVRRIVGLPGEEIVIRDDAYAYANGAKLQPPEHFRPLFLGYTARPELTGHFSSQAYESKPFLGDPKRPAKLAADEYFLLGDYSQSADDSREFGPMRRDQILGVVTYRFAPSERRTVFE
jgi:signal peptidase I